MGYQCSVICVRAPRGEVVEALAGSYEPTARETSWDLASQSKQAPSIAVAQLGDWVEIWDPGHRLAFDAKGEDERLALARLGCTVAMTMQSVVDLYAMRVYDGGRVVRRVTHERRKLRDEEGEPLEQENDIPRPSWGFDEQWCFTLLARVTGIEWRARDCARYLILRRVAE